MANVLKVHEQSSIEQLAAQGWSRRRIARTLKLDRKTVRRYLEAAAKAPTLSTPGSSGSEAKSPGVSTPGVASGPPVLPETPPAQAGRPSLCDPHRERIRQKLETELSAQRIYQDLVEEVAFAGSYQSVKRFVRELRAEQPEALYHLGFREPVAKSTLADANEQRDWRLWEDLAKGLMRKARRLYAGEDLGLDLDHTVYALDSSTIDLSLTLFPWARFRKTKAGIKLHTQLDLRGPIPTCIYISPARQHDVIWLDALLIEPGAFYVMDRGYMDFARLHRFTHTFRDVRPGTRISRVWYNRTVSVKVSQIGEEGGL